MPQNNSAFCCAQHNDITNVKGVMMPVFSDVTPPCMCTTFVKVWSQQSPTQPRFNFRDKNHSTDVIYDSFKFLKMVFWL